MRYIIWTILIGAMAVSLMTMVALFVLPYNILQEGYGLLLLTFYASATFIALFALIILLVTGGLFLRD